MTAILFLMRKLFKFFVVWLFGCSVVLFFPSSTWARRVVEKGEMSKFGSHLAGFNSPEMIDAVGDAYKEAGVEGWVPATVMVGVNSSGQMISDLLNACHDNQIWPILRLDGPTHGAKIEAAHIEQFSQSLAEVEVSEAAHEFQWPIFIEFANEPNMAREWGGALDPASYATSLALFISKVPDPFKVLNGAMNVSVRDTDETLDAALFWSGGPRELIGKLDGLAFNTYDQQVVPDHYDDRRGTWKSWLWELEMLGHSSETKPVFLLEYGLTPDASVSERKKFLEKEYGRYLDLAGDRSQLDDVEVITPLYCEDRECKKIKIAIFGFNGKVVFIDPVGGSTIPSAPKEGEEEEERGMRCGEPGGISSLRDAYETMPGCAEPFLRPYGVALEKTEDRICQLVRLIPKIGPILCPFKDVTVALNKRTMAREAQVSLEPLPETETSAVVFNEEGEVKIQGVTDRLADFLISVISRTSSEDQGYLKQFIPHDLSNGDLSTAALAETPGSKRAQIITTHDKTKRMLLPAALGGAKSPGVPLPPELEPTPTPLPPGVPTPTPLPPGEPTPTPVPTEDLWYRIDYRDTEVAVTPEKKEEIISLVSKYWPDSSIKDRWDYVVHRALNAQSAGKVGWNPAFVIALWIEESGASGVHAWDVGCTGAPKNNLEAGLDCLFGLSYSNRDFPEFMCIFSEGHYPCIFSINPNFTKNLKVWYDRLVPPGTYGAARPL